MSVTPETRRQDPPTARRPYLIGRADLVRLFAASPDAAHASLASALGWELRPESPVDGDKPIETSRRVLPTAVRSVPDATEVKPEHDSGEWPARRMAARFWRPTQHEPQATLFEPAKESPRGRLAWTNRPPSAARHEPLAAWRVLGPRLRSAIAGLFHSRELDVARAVENLAEGRIDRPLPLRSVRRWGSAVQVIVDRSVRLMPFFRDEMLVVAALRKLLGRDRVEVYFGRDPDERRFVRIGIGKVPLLPYRAPLTGTHVLVLSDLGALDQFRPQLARRWLEFGRRVIDQGCRPLALAPCALGRVAGELKRLYRVRGWGPRESAASSSSHRTALVRRLLSLVSFAVRVEPGLLRACRRLLDGADDPGLESDVWQDFLFVNRTSEAGELGPSDEIAKLIGEFEREPPAIRQAVLQELRKWRTEVGCEVYFEELARLSSETRGLVDDADWRDARAAWHFHKSEVLRRRPDQVTPLTDYARRLVHRVTDETLLDPEIGHLAIDMRRHLSAAAEGEPLPPPPQRVSVFQAGNQLILRGEDDGAAEPSQPPEWSRLVSVRTRGGAVEIEGQSEGSDGSGGSDGQADSARVCICLNGTETHRFEIPRGDRLTIRTDAEAMRLRATPRPDWADAAGRDRYGAWADVDILGVKTRWRWIPPGSFQMGSPESEPGRWDNEGPQHWVTLTRGFWIAETPCTQALWVAVMGKNPSYFDDLQRPVEQVTWNDVQTFLERLNQRIHGLDAALPTEVQWEYACRAGSTSALYRIAGHTGEIEILGERNAPALDPIAWYGGNSGLDFELPNGADSRGWPAKQYPHERAGTHPVGRKAPNAWGLYDMLGNVWEWCSDGMRDYAARAEVDPAGADVGSDHVGSRGIRGGSWGGHARGVRCAYRSQYPAEYRGHGLGFRLVRVQDGS